MKTKILKHSITKKRRLKKSIKESLMVVLFGTIGAMALIAMFIGAAIQEQTRLEMETQEVER